MTCSDLQKLSDEELASQMRLLFSHLSKEDTARSPTRGGRSAAKAALAKIKPQSYERSRDFLTGDATHLSAYLRHGVLTLAEVRDAALEGVKDPAHAGKLINEFAWRDYWQRLYFLIGEGVWQDREAYKTGYQASDYTAELTRDVSAGTTTLACMDAFAHQLTETGYLHNHARMWFAAYVVHWRRVAWHAGARWFLEHLIDGDPASNNLSWQWVGSTFSTKAYIFNRQNLERYTAGAYCRVCPHAGDRSCPFEQDYDSLTQTLFPRLNQPAGNNMLPTAPRTFMPARESEQARAGAGRPLLWIHTDSLNPESAMLTANPDNPAVFIWDLEWLIEGGISFKRIVFLAECLREMPRSTDLRVGDIGSELLEAARASGASYIIAQRTPDPRLQAAALAVEAEFPVVWYDPPAFAESSRAFDLKRFSRYWQRAQSSAMQLTRK